MRAILRILMLAAAFVLTTAHAVPAKEPPVPKVGDKAADFRLTTLTGEKIQLSALRKEGPVVVVVLRGYPGYQCPICSAQVGQFLARADELAAAKAKLVLVYPGPGKELEKHAAEFIRGQKLPKHAFFVTDPDYAFTIAYRLRWDAVNETAYPATFVIGREGQILFAKVSGTHGNRAQIADVLKAL